MNSTSRERGHVRVTAIFTIALASALTTFVPKEVRADGGDKAVCADAYRNAQTQRKSGALKRARESLVVCVSDRCPSVLQPDCARWLTEVEAAMPSLSFAAKDASGKDVIDARVSIDGVEVAQSLDGKAISLDPGAHTVRFERAGESPIEEPVIVREGEKARIVSVSWGKAAPAVTEPKEPAPVMTSSGPPASAWILGGVGVAGLATFAVLGLTGLERRSSLERDCFGTCSQSDVDSVKTQLLAADIALGVGVVSLGVATVLFFTQRGEAKPAPAPAARTPKPPTVAIDVAIKPGGGTAGLVGRF